MKRILAILLALALLLCGCGQESGSTSILNSQKTETAEASSAEAQTDDTVPPYYDVEFTQVGEGLADAYEWLWHDGQFLCTKTAGNNDNYPRTLYWTDQSGAEIQELPVALEGNEAINSYCIGGDGNVYAIISDMVDDALTGPDGHQMDGYASSRLIAMDQTGNLLFETPLDQDGTYGYFNLAASGDGRIFASQTRFEEDTGYFSDHYLVRISESGIDAVASLRETLGDSARLSGMLTAQDGTLLLEVQQNDWPVLYGFDLDSLALTEQYFQHTGAMQWPELSCGAYADFYVLDENTGLTSYDLDGTTHDYFKLSDLPTTVPSNVTLVGEPAENVWLFLAFANGRYLMTVTGQWEPLPENSKITLTVGSDSDLVGYTSLEDAIVEFNLLNADYELVLKDYSNDSTLDQDAMMDQLNQDILNGDGPDILVLREYGFPCNVYAGNGYLADLYPLMAADETFTASDYYENILQTYENQGKLYGLVTSYWVDTVFTSSDYLNVTDGWTPTECQALAAQSDIPLMQGYEVDVDYASRSFAAYVLGDGIKDYIDGDTCDFTSGEFAAMLEILKTDYPFNDYDTVADSLLVKNGTVLAGVESIYDITTMLSCAWKYGENYVMTGFPSPNRSRISIHPQGALGIAQTTAYPEVCWEFLKQILAEEDQWILYGFSGMSLKKSVMEEAVSRTTLPADDPDAYSLNMKVGVGDDSVDVTGEPLTQAQAEDFLRILETTKCAMVDTETISIVQEEAASFFSGDKTAQEVAEIIQNRVQLHLWEQS